MKITKLENKCSSQKYLTGVLFSIILLFAATILQTSSANAAPMSQLGEQLEQVLLAEDWEKIVNMLSKDNDPNLPVVHQLIKAHACLATNRNNESLCLFLGASSNDDLQEWNKWSEDFATRQPESPIAYYFKGDAAARRGH